MVGRWILARLRHRRFFSLFELNAAIRALLDDLNNRSMRGWGTSRRALFEQLDRPALERLPAEPYEYAEWKRCRVNIDYHVEIAKHYYSVPHQLIRQEVEARITAATVEIFHRGKRVASHRRSARPHRPTTVAEHMPEFAPAISPTGRMSASAARRPRLATVPPILADVILRSRPHPEQGFRSCIGVSGLVKRYGAARSSRLRAGAALAPRISYRSVEAILRHHLDRVADDATPELAAAAAPRQHPRRGLLPLSAADGTHAQVAAEARSRSWGLPGGRFRRTALSALRLNPTRRDNRCSWNRRSTSSRR